MAWGRLDRPTLARTCDFIEDSLTRRISLGALAAQCHLSAFHFASQFKVAMGISPGQYVLGRRIELAKRLLMSTDASVEVIAWSLGFQNMSHFRRQFRSIVGILPGELREIASRITR